uniref:Odorant receptor n=1 Tax=Protaetia brevitarsis TaxID=348688 RepID=A0A411HR50_PROBE|nr:odorant receptor [Protaetia brevitarsis]
MDTNDIHLKINMKSLFVLGAFRFRFKCWLTDIAYRTYSYFIRTYFVTFIICEYIELITMPDKRLLSIVEILAVSLIYSTAAWRLKVYNSKSFNKLIRQLREVEHDIFSVNNTDLLKIYNEHVRTNSRICTGFMWIGVLTVIPYYIHPILQEASANEATYMNVTHNNITKLLKIRPLPLSSWFPYNRYEYYYYSYAYHIVAAAIGASMVVLTDLLFVSIMIFLIGQLKTLQYHFKNAKKIAMVLKLNIGTTYNNSLNYTIKYGIRMHQFIIRYVEDLDKSMSRLMLVDFAVASLQMATLGLQMIVVKRYIFKQFFRLSNILRRPLLSLT